MAGSRFRRRQRVQPTPAVCKSVDRPTGAFLPGQKKPITVGVTGDFGSDPGDWVLNDLGPLEQQGNPLFIWEGVIGDPLHDHADIRLDNETAIPVLTVHFIGKRAQTPVLVRVRIVFGKNLSKPFDPFEVEISDIVSGGSVRLEILF